MKKIIILFTVLITVSTVIFVFAINWWKTNSQPVSASTQEKRFVIIKGSSAEKVANDLYDQGLIRSPLAFKFYLQLNGIAGSILPGEYDLTPSMDLQEISEQLMSGPDELWVTIPEGLRREQMPEIFVDSLKLEGKEADNFERDFLTASKDLEGYLFPETYLFPPDVSAEQVVIRMNDTFESLTEEMDQDIANSEYSQKELITLASIVERETRTDDERPIVAGIFFNRLELGMPLQADATVQYARDNQICDDLSDCELWEPVLRGDLEYYDSPYNTYTNAGIPPAPIANPGLTSINAVVYPEETDYLFYLHDSDGNIHYGRNAQEHNANKAKYIDGD